MKLCMIVVPEAHERQLLKSMREARYRFTQIDARGGYRGQRVATVITAIEDRQVPGLHTLLHRDFPEITMPMPAQAFGLDVDEGGDEMTDVRVHGAVMFVLPLDELFRS
jgi:uncharacterized protein YaaQ